MGDDVAVDADGGEVADPEIKCCLNPGLIPKRGGPRGASSWGFGGLINPPMCGNLNGDPDS